MRTNGVRWPHSGLERRSSLRPEREIRLKLEEIAGDVQQLKEEILRGLRNPRPQKPVTLLWVKYSRALAMEEVLRWILESSDDKTL